jgi:hypothetical protein
MNFLDWWVSQLISGGSGCCRTQGANDSFIGVLPTSNVICFNLRFLLLDLLLRLNFSSTLRRRH